MNVDTAGGAQGSESVGEMVEVSAGPCVELRGVAGKWLFSTLSGGEWRKDPMIGVASDTLSGDGSSTGCMRL
jgi:hypothetical protein